MSNFETSDPFWLGYHAYASGDTLDVCLFSLGSDPRRSWIDGWEFARFATAGLSLGCETATNVEGVHPCSNKVSG